MLTVAMAGCGFGGTPSGDGFVTGEAFSYMAETTDTETGTQRFGLISGTVGSGGQITGELQVVEVRDGSADSDTVEFTGTANDDGTAVFQGIGPDDTDVHATLEDAKGVMVTDTEPGFPATSWDRASLPAFNNTVQDAVRN